MKKITLFILILLLAFQIISAVEVDMKTEFSQGETFMAKVSGNFFEPILGENIFFYRGHVRIPLISYVGKINDEFYIYAQLSDKNPNNYSLVIKNIKYLEKGKLSEDEIIRNFSIKNNTADFSIDKGFVITNDDFFIEIQNLQEQEIDIEIQTNASEETKGFLESLFGSSQKQNSVILKAGEIKKVKFYIKNITDSIKLSTKNLTYTIPVYLIDKKSVEKQKDFRFELSELNISMPTNSSSRRIIYLINTGEETLENINLSLSESLKKYASLSIKEIKELKENKSARIELNLSSGNEEEKIEGQITAKANSELYAYSAIFLNFIKDYVPSEDDEDIPIAKICSELGGKTCKSEEECEKEVYAKDGVCCLSKCEKEEKSSTGKIIGWTMVIAIAVFLIWFFKVKYLGAKKKINLFGIGGK